MDTINKMIQLLNERGHTQKELTDYLGIEKSVFSSWKNGKSQSYNKYLSKIAEFFDVSTDYLLNNDETSFDKDNADQDRVKVLFRHLQEVPDNDREQLINTLESTIDIYLKAKGLK